MSTSDLAAQLLGLGDSSRDRILAARATLRGRVAFIPVLMRHFTFGSGAPHCLGATLPIARLGIEAGR